MISGTKEIITDEIALSERAEEIDTLHEGQLVQEIVKLLKRTLRKNDDLFALSAPAIGFNKRIFCMKFEKDEIYIIIYDTINHGFYVNTIAERIGETKWKNCLKFWNR